ncbi:MAG: hypothetical protein V1495_09920 [Pseudomonadota bacterium]
MNERKRIVFQIHGVRIGIRSDSADATDLMCERLADYRADGIERCEAEIEIQTKSAPFSPAGIRKEFSWIRSRPLYGDFDNDILRLTDGRSISVTRYEERRAEIFLDPETLTDPLFTSRTFLPMALLELLRTFGFFCIHGALCVREKRGILILGHGGSGKSTISAALLREGFKIVGDDNLLFHLGPGGVSLGFPFERELSLSPEALAQFDPLASIHPTAKIRIPLRVLPSDRVATNAVPNEIVYLTGEDEDAGGPLDPAEAFTIILEENPLFLLSSRLASSHLQTIRTLIRNARSCSVSLKHRHPLDLEEIAARFLRLASS